MLKLGEKVPDFHAETTDGPIDFYKWAGTHWVILFSHPADFTPVCTTELGEVAKLKPEWDKRDVKPIGLSVDPLSSHKSWVGDIEETQSTRMNFPIIADDSKKVAELYGMLHPAADSTHTVRSVFVIDPSKVLRLELTYPASTGRNFHEILRAIDSLQLTSEYQLATPVNWRPGEEAIVVPSLSDDEAAKRFPKGVRKVKPYLRFTADPRGKR